jgi:hypothetical protein
MINDWAPQRHQRSTHYEYQRQHYCHLTFRIVWRMLKCQCSVLYFKRWFGTVQLRTHTLYDATWLHYDEVHCEMLDALLVGRHHHLFYKSLWHITHTARNSVSQLSHALVIRQQVPRSPIIHFRIFFTISLQTILNHGPIWSLQLTGTVRFRVHQNAYINYPTLILSVWTNEME